MHPFVKVIHLLTELSTETPPKFTFFFMFTVVEQLKKTSLKSEDRISKLESRFQSLGNSSQAQPAQPTPANNAKSDDDDGVDLFGSDSDDEDDAAAKVREQRLAEYAAKKSKSK